MGAAMEYACGDINGRSERISALRDRLVAGLLEISGSRLNGGISPRLCGNVNVSFSGVEGGIPRARAGYPGRVRVLGVGVLERE